MFNKLGKYQIPRYQVMRGAKLWERLTQEYELTVECDSVDLLIMLDTPQPLHKKGKNFRRTFSMCEDKFRLKQFKHVDDLFENIQNEKICTVDPENGVLKFTFGSALVEVSLEKIDLNEYFRIELEFRRLARRQFFAEEDLREENRKLITVIEEHKMRQIQIQKQGLKQSQLITELENMKKQFKKQANKNQQDLEEVKKEVKKVKEGLEKIGGQNEKEREKLWQEVKKSRREQEVVKNEEMKARKKMKQELQGGQQILSHKLSDLLVQVRKVKQMKSAEKKNISIDLTTPYADNFQVQQNSITLQHELKSETGSNLVQMVLLDMVGEEVFSFVTRIKKINGRFTWIGVTDRTTQREKQVPDAAHSILYYGGGKIYYGGGESSEHKCQYPDDMLNDGMEVVVEVDRKNCIVTFTLKGSSTKNNKPIDGTRVYNVHSPILKHPHCHFVPVFVLCFQGDTIGYQIQ